MEKMASRKIAMFFNRKCGKKLGRVMTVFTYAVLEWLLILMLIVCALLSYLTRKFAEFFGLYPPCIWCSRLDHFLGDQDQGFYKRLVCDDHAREISSLGYCHAHNHLADVNAMCEDCLLSFALEDTRSVEFGKNNRGFCGLFHKEENPLGISQNSKGIGNPQKSCDDNERTCSCCQKPLKKKVLLHPLVKTKLVDEGLRKEDLQLGKLEKQSREAKIDEVEGMVFSQFIWSHPNKENQTSKLNILGGLNASMLGGTSSNVLDGIGYTELRGTSGSESESKEESESEEESETESEEESETESDTSEEESDDVQLSSSMVEESSVCVSSRDSEMLAGNEQRLERNYSQNGTSILDIDFSRDDFNLGSKDDDLDELFNKGEGSPIADILQKSERGFNNLLEVSLEMPKQSEEVLISMDDETVSDKSALEVSGVAKTELQDFERNSIPSLEHPSRNRVEENVADKSTLEVDAVAETKLQNFDWNSTPFHDHPSHTPEDEKASDKSALEVSGVAETELRDFDWNSIPSHDHSSRAPEDEKVSDKSALEVNGVAKSEYHDFDWNSLSSHDNSSRTHEGEKVSDKSALEVNDVTNDWNAILSHEHPSRNPEDEKVSDNNTLKVNDAAKTELPKFDWNALPSHEHSSHSPNEIQEHRRQPFDTKTKEEFDFFQNSDNGKTEFVLDASSPAGAMEESSEQQYHTNVSSLLDVDDSIVLENEGKGSQDVNNRKSQNLNLIDLDIFNPKFESYKPPISDNILKRSLSTRETLRTSDTSWHTLLTRSLSTKEMDPNDVLNKHNFFGGPSTPEEYRNPETPKSGESPHYLQKRFSIERNDSGFESREGSALSEIEGESEVDRLKRHLNHAHKFSSNLFAELEEERNASAVAANQAMAMITRLQEEKAAMQMEALQYQRMVEEQAEYDHEALRLLNDVVVKREREIKDLEKELELYRKRFLHEEERKHKCKTRISPTEKIKSYKYSSTEKHQEGRDPCNSSLAEDTDDTSSSLHEAEDDVDLHQQNQSVNVESENDENEENEMDDSFDESMVDLEEERMSILEQLRTLEERLQNFAEDNEPASSARHISPDARHSEANGDVHSSAKDLSSSYGIARDTVWDDDLRNVSFAEKSPMTPKAKKLLPMFNATDYEEELDTNASYLPNETEDWRTRSMISRDKGRQAMKEEVQQLNERLQALEADREFIKHSIKSLKKGDEGMKLLQEIVQHLRELRRIDGRVSSYTDSLLQQSGAYGSSLEIC